MKLNYCILISCELFHKKTRKISIGSNCGC